MEVIYKIRQILHDTVIRLDQRKPDTTGLLIHSIDQEYSHA